MAQPPDDRLHPAAAARESAVPAPDPGALQLGPEQATRRLVLLHGWGADADDLLDLAPLLVSPETSVVSLRAPGLHPAGVGRQWYSLLWRDMVPEPAWEEVPAAWESLRHRIEALAATVPLEQTALLGFSQGAAMALDVATGGAAPLPLAALIACSGYPHRDWQPLQGGPPVLLTHGREDPVVAIHHCDALNQRLMAAGVPVNRRDFSGGHGIDPDLFPLMRHFLDAAWADRS